MNTCTQLLFETIIIVDESNKIIQSRDKNGGHGHFTLLEVAEEGEEIEEAGEKNSFVRFLRE